MSANVLAKRVTRGLGFIVLVFGSAAAWSAGETTQAVWKALDTMFTYSGFTSYYSCDGLADRVRDVLRQLGARNLKVYGLGCNLGPSVAPSVRIMGEIPVEATPEALADIAKFREQHSKDAVVKTGSAVPDEFAATRRIVTLSSRRDVGIESGDCELLEQMKGRLFPDIGVKVVNSQLRCMPRQVDIGVKTVEVEALMPVNKAVAEATPE